MVYPGGLPGPGVLPGVHLLPVHHPVPTVSSLHQLPPPCTRYVFPAPSGFPYPHNDRQTPFTRTMTVRLPLTRGEEESWLFLTREVEDSWVILTRYYCVPGLLFAIFCLKTL